MFTHDYTINGSHATKLKFLTKKKNDDKGNPESQPYYFRRYIDVYLNAVVFGLLYNRRAVFDDSSDRARIYADAFATEKEKCKLLYNIVMLLDETSKLSTEERLDRAFRDPASGDMEKIQKNMALFNSYMLGGIDVLYEKLTVGCVNQDDYNDRVVELMKAFDDEISGVNVKDKIKKLFEDED